MDKRYLAERVVHLEEFLESHDLLFQDPHHLGCSERIKTAVEKLCQQQEGVRELASVLRGTRD